MDPRHRLTIPEERPIERHAPWMHTESWIGPLDIHEFGIGRFACYIPRYFDYEKAEIATKKEESREPYSVA
jgi:hypothetical protein